MFNFGVAVAKKHVGKSEGNLKASIQALTPPPKIAMNLGVLATA